MILSRARSSRPSERRSTLVTGFVYLLYLRIDNVISIAAAILVPPGGFILSIVSNIFG